MPPTKSDADRNWRRFVLFRVLFNSRFYYPILAIFFLDLGLTPTEYTILNFIWAIAIVMTDIPAGVLADRIGRKPLIVGAAICMVGEMILLILAPWRGGMVLFLYCIANRALSGIAEGMASGADEALVFDSLAELGRSEEWSLVLDQVIRWQSVGLVIAMLVGGASYDPVFMTRLAAKCGLAMHLSQSTTLRFPIYLNLAAAVLALFVVLGLREPVMDKSKMTSIIPCQPGSAMNAWSHLLSAGKWVLGSPAALFVMIGGLLLDSVTRLFATFSSSYYRIIHVPEATFGIIGAALAGLGIVLSPLARRMVAKLSLKQNYAIIALVCIASLIGVAFQVPLWGLLFVIPMWGALTVLGFMVSYYLNAMVESHHRATVLSFKGVAFNLGYGFVGLLFAMVLKGFNDGRHPDRALMDGFRLMPLWLALTLGLLAVTFWKRRASVSQKAEKIPA